MIGGGGGIQDNFEIYRNLGKVQNAIYVPMSPVQNYMLMVGVIYMYVHSRYNVFLSQW
jgi:hypothetical protein